GLLGDRWRDSVISGPVRPADRHDFVYGRNRRLLLWSCPPGSVADPKRRKRDVTLRPCVCIYCSRWRGRMEPRPIDPNWLGRRPSRFSEIFGRSSYLNPSGEFVKHYLVLSRTTGF